MAKVRKNSEPKNFFLGPCPLYSHSSHRWVNGEGARLWHGGARSGEGGTRVARNRAEVAKFRPPRPPHSSRQSASHRAAGQKRSPFGCAASLRYPAPAAVSADSYQGVGAAPPCGSARVSLDTVPTAKSPGYQHPARGRGRSRTNTPQLPILFRA